MSLTPAADAHRDGPVSRWRIRPQLIDLVRSKQDPEEQPQERLPNRRLAPEDRERLIVEEAIRFFAEVGFGGQTRELAQRLGVTQPLLYRYFPTKSDLIDRVYQEVYLGRWDPEWESLLDDRAIPLRQRLVEFYRRYTEAIFSYEWMRIYLFSGLRGAEINKRYLKHLENRLLRRICTAFRAENALPPPEVEPISAAELEVLWAMHAGIFYYGVRKYVYETEVADDLEGTIERCVDAIFDGVPAVLKTLPGAGDEDAG